jgi:hypothetical protein
MSDEHMNDVLERIAADHTSLDLERFQKNVWDGLEASARRVPDISGLSTGLAIRAAPAVLALLVGSVVGVGLAPSGEPDLLAVFGARAELPLTTLMGEGTEL